MYILKRADAQRVGEDGWGSAQDQPQPGPEDPRKPGLDNGKWPEPKVCRGGKGGRGPGRAWVPAKGLSWVPAKGLSGEVLSRA